MFMRRRPLLATAVVGGAAYHMGKKGAQASQQEAEQNAQIQELQQQQAQPQAQQAPTPAMPVAAAAPAAGGLTEQLTQLKSLLDAGVLTQAEFETAKQKVLQGG
jgi:multidrug resistance efflux pump